MDAEPDPPFDDEAALLDEVAAVERFIEDEEPGAPPARRPGEGLGDVEATAPVR